VNDTVYLSALGLPRPGRDVRPGGQELILGECYAALHPLAAWFPLPQYCETLLDLYARSHDVSVAESAPRDARAVYLGTPTILDDEPLFEVDPGERWTKARERIYLRRVVAEAERLGYQRIVTGLGSGDITVGERKADMGDGARVVCVKHFDTFSDWVLVREI
jgi:hypothetical protein